MLKLPTRRVCILLNNCSDRRAKANMNTLALSYRVFLKNDIPVWILLIPKSTRKIIILVLFHLILPSLSEICECSLEDR